MTQEGRRPRKRMPDLTTKPGPLAPLMRLRLVDLTPAAVEAWAKHEAHTRPARVRLALRLLKAFLRWAGAEPDLKGRVDPTAASAKKAREAAGKPSVRNDYLQREQLAAWFTHVRAIPNPVIAAYLQCLLLTSARREELAGLPRRNGWVFSSTQALAGDTKDAARRARYHATKGTMPPEGDVSISSASGRLVDPSIAHRRACAAAGLEGLTLHGLRRSFSSPCEWLDIPGGISAQIQGHAPQGVREQNYIGRPLDLVRVHHERSEAWILEQAKSGLRPDDCRRCCAAGGERCMTNCPYPKDSKKGM